MKSISTAIILLAASFRHSSVLATPRGAGTCAAGKSIASLGHGHHGSGTGNTFAESNLVLMWGGDVLDPTETNTIGAATDHTFTLTTNDDSKFKGFLLRLSGKNGASASSTTFVAADSSLAQVSNLCTSDVIGITHKDNNGKSGVAVTLNHPEAAAELLLEVTVVTANAVNWSFDAFDLLVSGDVNATASPTASPPQSGSAILGVSNVMMLGAIFLASFAFM